MLDEEPNFSVRIIADILKENPSTVDRYQTRYLWFNYKHLDAFPTYDIQKVDRSIQSLLLKNRLE